MIKNSLLKAKQILAKEKKILSELNSLYGSVGDKDINTIILSQIKKLKNSFIDKNNEFLRAVQNVHLIKQLHTKDSLYDSKPKIKKPLEKIVKIENKTMSSSVSQKLQDSGEGKPQKIELTKLEKITIKRLKQKDEKITIKKDDQPNIYFNWANKMFFNFSRGVSNEPMFKTLERDLVKTNLRLILPSYISIMLFTTFLTFIGSILLGIFFLFFNIEATLPILTLVEDGFLTRLLKVFWMPIVFPLIAFIVTYFYPAMERKSSEAAINQELPFATIHMSAISGSMVEPSKIFQIIISTKEYPAIEKELTKLVNSIHVYGKDLVTALKNTAYNSPSVKLADLLNGLATTIHSGGSLPNFFDKRAETLLFEHRLEKEKVTKAAETFMDIYISVVIAAPMILMLLLIMMKMSGLGIALSTSMIGLVMVLGVTILNIVFLTFLYLKQPNE